MRKCNVAFAGSGQLYPAFIGVLRCLRDKQIEVAEIAGTSGGAIIAAAAASGIDIGPELLGVIKRTLPLKNRLFDFSIKSLFKKWGLIRGVRIETALDMYFCDRLGDAKFPIHITASNISARKVRVFSSVADPRFKTSRAVRASISLPIIFAPVEIAGELHVDGGWMKNMPSDVFCNNLPVLGFRFRPASGIVKNIASVWNYLLALLESIIDGEVDDTPLGSPYIISIPTRFSTLAFNVSEEDVDAMVAEGYRAAEEWLAANEEKVFKM